jgi:hypothetical protein
MTFVLVKPALESAKVREPASSFSLEGSSAGGCSMGVVERRRDGPVAFGDARTLVTTRGRPW